MPNVLLAARVRAKMVVPKSTEMSLRQVVKNMISVKTYEANNKKKKTVHIYIYINGIYLIYAYRIYLNDVHNTTKILKRLHRNTKGRYIVYHPLLGWRTDALFCAKPCWPDVI